MITDARPMTIVPVPMPTSAKPLLCATSAPQIATIPFDRSSPRTIITSVLTPFARIMWGFAPVARIAIPSSVPKNQYVSRMASTTTTVPMRRIFDAASIPQIFHWVKSVSCWRSGRFALPITRRLME